ncbi:MAG: hypothetical protein SangKO_068140 [Sandaracinaceae bacterium]
MNQQILITRSSGLVGTALTSTLLAEGVDVVRFDLRGRDRTRLHDIVTRVDGVVHLAAVSRAVWGEGFSGDPSQVKALFGWQPFVGLEENPTLPVRAFHDARRGAEAQEAVR